MIPENSIDNLEGSCSIQLSYGRNLMQFKVQSSKFKVQSGNFKISASVRG